MPLWDKFRGMRRIPKTISIIVPTYNEAATLPAILSMVKHANTMRLRKQIIVVDDASSDTTRRILKKIKGITVVSHRKNRGKGAALRSGFARAKGDIILIQDADTEYSPKDYPKLLEPFFESRADVVYGSRFRGSEPRRVIYFSHHVANQALTFYSNLLTNINISDMECGYKVFHKNVLESILPSLVSNRFGIEPELTAKVAKLKHVRFFEVGITYQGRTYAEGKKIGFLDGLRAVLEITYFNLFT